MTGKLVVLKIMTKLNKTDRENRRKGREKTMKEEKIRYKKDRGKKKEREEETNDRETIGFKNNDKKLIKQIDKECEHKLQKDKKREWKKKEKEKSRL